jgi:hypothetical protein
MIKLNTTQAHAKESQTKELLAKGLDNAHKHASTTMQREQQVAQPKATKGK